MTKLHPLVTELYDKVKLQKVPVPISQEDLYKMIVSSIRHLFVMTGRAGLYSNAQYSADSSDAEAAFEIDLGADEIEFVLLTAQIKFYEFVQTNVNNIVGYSTDALSVTNADKPYQYIANTLQILRTEQRKIYLKMGRYGTVSETGV